MSMTSKKTILLSASFGGHFIQLKKIKSLIDGDYVFKYMSTDKLLKDSKEIDLYVKDFNSKSFYYLPVGVAKACRYIYVNKIDLVITTGALPGLAAIVAGKLLNKKTVWIDSIANHDRISVSGRLAKYFSDVWATQWMHLSSEKGPVYLGRIL